MPRIEFTNEVIDEMKSHALRDYPHECCGALFGREAGIERSVLAAMPIDNVSDDDRRRRFSIAPRDYLRAEREAELLGLTLLGFYHSHPDHPARPSATDREFAIPGFSYPILSVTRENVQAITSWRLDDADGEYEKEELKTAR